MKTRRGFFEEEEFDLDRDGKLLASMAVVVGSVSGGEEDEYESGEELDEGCPLPVNVFLDLSDSEVWSKWK